MKKKNLSELPHKVHFLISIFLLIFISIIPNNIFAQSTITVRGNIVDENNEIVIGASILVKGTTTGTISDIDGNFTLPAKPGSILLVSYVGYNSQEIKIGEDTKKLNIRLKQNAQVLNEVTVQVGYTSIKRANLLGSVTSVSPKEIEDVVTGNLSTALQGTMPGVTIGQASGAPGASTSIQIRIPGTWNNEPPLFVIDGMVRDQAAFDILDPSEVESVSVLKDAAAAVYGARSAGGVILVKTKRGKEGKVKVSYTSTYGLSDATRMPELMSAYDQAIALNDYTRGYYKWNQASLEANNPSPSERKPYFSESELNQLRSSDYNWIDYAWKSAFQTRQNISISGGTDKSRYYAGGSYLFQNGNFDNLSMNKYTMRVALDVNLTNDWTLSAGISANKKNTSMPYNALDKEPEKMYNTFSTLIRTPKWIPPYINGLPVGQNGTILAHPLYINDINSYKKSYSSDVTANLALNWNIPWIKGLSAKVTFDYQTGNSGGITYAKPYYLYNFEPILNEYGGSVMFENTLAASRPSNLIQNGNKYSQSSSSTESYQLNAFFNYDRKIGNHNIKGIFVFEQSYNSGLSMSGTLEKMIIDNVESSIAFGDGVTPVFDGSWSTPVGRQAFLGRFNYDYAGKYLIETTCRYEASTKFAPEDRWGFFPTVALGWRISEENFFKNNINPDIFDDFKIRASLGLTGNDNGVPLSWENNYLYAGNVSYLGGTTTTGGISPNNGGLSMLGITWEKSRNFNGGFDARFLKDLNLGFDIFYRHSYDILQQRSSALSYTTGLGTNIPRENYGIQNSWGGELSLNYNKQINKDWSVNVRVNMDYASSRVIQKIQAPAILGTWKDEVGRIAGGEVGYVSTGIMTQADVDELAATYGTYVDTNGDTKLNYTIFGEQPEPGMLNFKDVGGPGNSNEPDGIIDPNDERIISKYDNPPYHYGITLGFGWKNLKFSAIFTGQFGNDVVYDKAVYTTGEGNRSNFDWLSYKSNNLTMWNDHWTPENTDASMPRLYNGMSNYRSTFWMRDGHSLTLRTIQISYDMPKEISMKIGIPSARFYLSGSNILDIINPFQYKDASLSSWMDYPIMRSFNLGVNIAI